MIPTCFRAILVYLGVIPTYHWESILFLLPRTIFEDSRSRHYESGSGHLIKNPKDLKSVRSKLSKAISPVYNSGLASGNSNLPLGNYGILWEIPTYQRAILVYLGVFPPFHRVILVDLGVIPAYHRAILVYLGVIPI